jgi:hypothetical protein
MRRRDEGGYRVMAFVVQAMTVVGPSSFQFGDAQYADPD